MTATFVWALIIYLGGYHTSPVVVGQFDRLIDCETAAASFVVPTDGKWTVTNRWLNLYVACAPSGVKTVTPLLR